MEQLLEKISRARILVIGDLMLDRYIWGDATRISPEAPVPVVRIERETETAGGAANVALNLRALGANVEVIGSCAADSHGEHLRAILENKGIEVKTSSAPRTITKTRVMCRRQQLCRLDNEDAPSDYALDIAPFESSIKAADAVIISDYAKGVVTSELIAAVQSFAREGQLITLDPKPRPELKFRGLGMITPNRIEALKLAGLGECATLADVCAALHEKHATELLVITLGADGMLLSRGGKPLRQIPTAAREVFDVSGAGDTVAAAMTAALATGADAEAAASFANIAAGVVVAKLGTAVATPKEILKF